MSTPGIRLCLFATAPPSWETREDALDYLGGEFVERIGVLEDLLAAGILPPSVLAFDLGQIAEALAAFIRSPAQLVFDDQTPDVEATAQLACCATELARKIQGGVVKGPDGLEQEVHRRSVSLLTTSLAHAAKGLGDDTESWYDQEQEERRRFWESNEGKAKLAAFEGMLSSSRPPAEGAST